MPNYKKCDCCGKMQPEDKLEDATIVLKKCKDHELTLSPMNQPVAASAAGPVSAVAALGANGEGAVASKIIKPYARPPADIAAAFRPPQETSFLPGK